MNKEWVYFILLCIFSYLLGSVPFGLIYSKLRGIDIRKVGSGNIGATNVSRQFGFLGGFVPVFILDFLKGAIPVMVSRLIPVSFMQADLLMIVAGSFSILGHIFPVYLGFRGGKGVATSAGVFIFIAPFESLFSSIIFILVLIIAHIINSTANQNKKNLCFFKDIQKGVGISSVSAAISLPILIYLIEPNRSILLILSILIATIVIIRHRENIIKIIKGEQGK